MRERIRSTDPESRDLASACLAALDVLAGLERQSPRWAGYATIADRLSTRVACAHPHIDLLTTIQLRHALRDLAEALPSEATLLLELADLVHERSWVREVGVVPAVYKRRPHPTARESSAAVEGSQPWPNHGF